MSVLWESGLSRKMINGRQACVRVEAVPSLFFVDSLISEYLASDMDIVRFLFIFVGIKLWFWLLCAPVRYC